MFLIFQFRLLLVFLDESWNGLSIPFGSEKSCSLLQFLFFMGALHQMNLLGTESLKNGDLFYCCSGSYIKHFSLFEGVFEDHV